MSKRVLIIGLTERMGGVETFIFQTACFSDRDSYQYDYLVHGAERCVFQREIEALNPGEQHIYFTRKYKADPIGCILDLIRFYKTYGKRYDYIHLQTGSASELLYLFPYCLFFRAKVIVHSHNGNGYAPLINCLFRPLVNFVADCRLACSQTAAAWMFGKKWADKVEIIRNGIDVKRFAFDAQRRARLRAQYALEGKLVIGHVGRFAPQKNHRFLVEIFDHVLSERPDARLLLVGTGEMEAEILELVQEKGISSQVIFAGLQSQTDDFYNAFDLFLMPSLYEGLPIVGIEAQCAGLPCLFSEEIDRQILLTDRAKMLSLDSGAGEWSRVLLSMRSDDTQRQRYADYVRQAGYDIQDAVGQLEDVYGVSKNAAGQGG